MTKTEIRKIYRQKRESLSAEEIGALSLLIFENFSRFFQLEKGQNIHCFLTATGKNEVQTQLFIEYFQKCQCHIFVPKVVDGKMDSIELLPETRLVPNQWGISEPESNMASEAVRFDYVIVPLLYADHLGNRVGYGKGFYDRFFAEINPEVKKIGLNFFPPNEKIDDVWENDIPLDYLVTPTDVLSFTGKPSKFTK